MKELISKLFKKNRGCDWCKGAISGDGVVGHIDKYTGNLSLYLSWREVSYKVVNSINYCPICGTRVKPKIQNRRE